MKRPSTLVAIAGIAGACLAPAAMAETWYLYTTVYSGGSYSGATRPIALEMDSKQGCEVAGNKLKADAKSNKLEHIKNISFTCIKRQ